MCAVAKPRMSPAPGRQSKRQRSATPESEKEGSISRNVRQKQGEHNDLVDKDGDNSTGGQSDSLLVVGGVAQIPETTSSEDLGRVIAEESYCPSSPAPVQKFKNLSSSIPESPIFKKNKSSPYRMNPLIH